MSTQDDITSALRMVAGGASALALALPEPAAIVVRILGAAAGAASVAIDGGKTEAEVVAAIHRIRSLDTSAADAEVDAIVNAKPSREAQIEALRVSLSPSDRKKLGELARDPELPQAYRPLLLQLSAPLAIPIEGDAG